MIRVVILYVTRCVIILLLLAGTAARPGVVASAGAATTQTQFDGQGIRVVYVDADRIVLELNTADISMVASPAAEVDAPRAPSAAVTAADCQQIQSLGANYMAETGAPQLPIYTALIGIPPAGQVTWSLSEVQSVTIPISTPICPAPAARAEADSGGTIRYLEHDAAPDPTVYTQDVLYPHNLVQLQEVGLLRSQRLARVVLHPVQVNLVQGVLVHHQRFRITLHFPPTARAAQADIKEPPAFEQILADSLLNYEVAQAWRGQPVSGMAMSAWRPPEEAYRIAIDETGLYVLTYSDLAAAGFPVDTVSPSGLRMTHDGNEIAIRVLGGEDGIFNPGDKIFFYGEASTDRFAATNIYWLSDLSRLRPGATGLRMAVRPPLTLPGAETLAYGWTTVVDEENLNYVSALPADPGYDHWYGPRLMTTGFGQRARTDRVLTLAQPTAALDRGVLDLALATNVSGPHHVQIFLNGQQIDTHRWTGRGYRTLRTTFDHTLLMAGDNTVRIQLVNDGEGQVFDLLFVDSVRLHYGRALQGPAQAFAFTSPGLGPRIHTLAGFSSQESGIYDVTDPTRVELVQSAATSAGLTFSNDQSIEHRYFILSASQVRSPVRIEAAHPADLLTPETGADYIIIAPPAFLRATEPLARWRFQQGYRVQTINVQDIYDYFNYGRPAPEAIRDFLAYTYAHWPQPAPTYVLLVGDGHYDPLGYLASSGPSWIPPYLAMVDPDLGETAADNRYVAVVGDDIVPDMHIGRFPARMATEVTAMVNKTLRYEQTSVDEEWTQSMLFITDNLEGGGGIFYDYSDAVADGMVQTASGTTALVPETYRRVKYYLGQPDCLDSKPATACQQQIVDQLNQGALFVSYVGHGAKEFWAEEQLLNLSALQQLDNADRLPIMLPMTCLEGSFHEADPNIQAFGEAVVRMTDKGAVASWSPTGFGLASGHDYLERGFFQAVFHQEIVDVGAAATAGKLYLLANATPQKYDDLIDTYVLFGDPALRIRVPGVPMPTPTPSPTPGAQTYGVFLPVVSK